MNYIYMLILQMKFESRRTKAFQGILFVVRYTTFQHIIIIIIIITSYALNWSPRAQ